MDFGERIRAARRAAGVSQTELATKAGVNQTTLSRWEREGNPIADALTTIADALGVTVQWLMTGEGDGPSPISDAPPASHDEAPDTATGTHG